MSLFKNHWKSLAETWEGTAQINQSTINILKHSLAIKEDTIQFYKSQRDSALLRIKELQELNEEVCEALDEAERDVEYFKDLNDKLIDILEELEQQ